MNAQNQVPPLRHDNYANVIQAEFQSRRSEIESQLERLSSASDEYQKIIEDLISLEVEHRRRLTGVAYDLI